MGTAAVIGLVIAWALLAIPVALFVARMIRLRDRHRPHRSEPDTQAVDKPVDDPGGSYATGPDPVKRGRQRAADRGRGRR